MKTVDFHGCMIGRHVVATKQFVLQCIARILLSRARNKLMKINS